MQHQHRGMLAAAGAGAVATLVLITVLARNPRKDAGPPGQDDAQAVPGKANTILFITSDAASSVNVHLATLLALLRDHQHRPGPDPPLEIHYASSPAMQDRVKRITDAANDNAGGAQDQHQHPHQRAVVHFHVCAPVTQKTSAEVKFTPIPVLPPGRPAVETWAAIAAGPASLYRRWTDDGFDEAYAAVAALIDRVDPAVVVTARDSAMLPVKAAVRDSGRRWVVLFPNALLDSFVWAQRWFKAGWKFPAVASGHPFPLPARLVPLNMYITLRWLLGFRHMQRRAAAERAFVARHAVRDVHLPPPPRARGGAPYHLSASCPGAQVPMDDLPPRVHAVGPAVLCAAPAADQDPALHAWLAAPRPRAPRRTVLVNLGSLMRYTPAQAAAMAEAVAEVLRRLPDVQFLWKLRPEGEGPEGVTTVPGVLADHVVVREDHQKQRQQQQQQQQQPRQGEEEEKKEEKEDDDDDDDRSRPRPSGRVRIEPWLSVDPPALLRSGHVALSVHHAGAGSYHEAVAAGVPHVVLPLWFDCYNYAALVEDLGLGVWACRGTAPGWTAAGIAAAMLTVLGGATGGRFRARAREVARGAADGAAAAADIISDLAAGRGVADKA